MGSNVNNSKNVFSCEQIQKIQRGLELFNERKYWECHEELEHWWLEEPQNPARNVYWAVIQVAASLFHFRNGKLSGAISLLQKAKEKLNRCEDFKIESAELLQMVNWEEFKNKVRKIPDDGKLTNFEEMDQFEFKILKAGSDAFKLNEK